MNNDDYPWLVHWKNPINSKWIESYQENVDLARYTVDYIEKNKGAKSIYIQHVDGEVIYHRRDGKVQFGDWRF